MAADDWELRREARRYTYSADKAVTPGTRRMLASYARFYTALADSAGKKPDQPRETPKLPAYGNR